MFLTERIKELTEINAVSGNEELIREEILKTVTPYADSVSVDTMGNIIAFKRGSSPCGRKFIVSAHMDEVGFIVSDITDEGFLKFKAVGGIDARILPAQRVVIGENRVNGVMGIKAVHLQTPSERKSVIKARDMYIDIGATSKEDALKRVNKGDYVSFDSKFTKLGSDVIKAKALDDRVGCAVIEELIKGSYKEDIYFCFCVQEEVGLRGSRVIAQRIGADAAIVLESTTCSDTAGLKPHQYATVLGGGPALSVMDRASFSDIALNKFIMETAKKNGLEFQFKKSAMGGNDAGSYQTSSKACKTAVISLPCRYIHSPVSCAKTGDIEKMYALASCILKELGNFKDW